MGGTGEQPEIVIEQDGIEGRVAIKHNFVFERPVDFIRK
jgi:hypothetical protein